MIVKSGSLIEVLEARIAPASFVWDGSASTDWFTAANWTPDGIPDSDDTATLNISATINLPNATSVGAFVQSAGTFTGAGTLTVLGGFNWTGGRMSGTGVTNLNGGAVFGGGGNFAQLYLDGRTLNVPAGKTATLTGDTQLFFENGAHFNNVGTFLAQSDTGIFANGGAASLFNNAGTFTRNTGTGDFNFSVPIVSAGVINVATGDLLLNASSPGPITGDFNVSSGAHLDFASDFTLATNAAVTGNGIVEFRGGTVTIGGSFAISEVLVVGGNTEFTVATTGLQKLTVSTGIVSFNTNDTVNLSTLTLSASGTLSGTNTINIASLLNWTGGRMSGTGVTNVNAGVVLGGGGGFAQLFLEGRTLNVPAGQTATLPGNTQVFFENGAQFNNAGTFLAQSDYGIYANGGTASLFNNTGTFTRNNGTGDFSISLPFVNAGTINVATGNLLLNTSSPGPITGDFNVSSGAHLEFVSDFTLAASAAIAGSGTVDFRGGAVTIGGSFAIPEVLVFGGSADFNVVTTGLQRLTLGGGAISFNTTDTVNLSTFVQTGGLLSGSNTINVAALLNWTHGRMSGTGVTNANGGMALGASGNSGQLFLEGRTLNVPAGQTATMIGQSQVAFEDGARFNNAGTFVAQGGSGILANGGAPSLFNNTGTFTRNTDSTGLIISVPFANAGTVNLVTSGVTFNAGFTQTAAGAITGGQVVNFVGGVTSAGGTITGNVSNLGSTLSPGVNGAGGLTIDGNYTQDGGGTFKVDIGGAAVGQFDRLTVSGTAALNGTLEIALLGGFVPSSSQQFNVLSFNATTGTFANVTGAPGFSPTYEASRVLVSRAGVEYVWDGGGGADTSWFNMQNWGPDGVPGAGDGATLSSSATITLASATTVGSFTQSNGILTGAGVLTTPSFVWTGGTQAGSGTTLIPVGGSFEITESLQKSLTQRTLDQRGAGVWTGSGNLQLSNGAIFNNSGTFDIQNDASIQILTGGSAPLLTNTGTIEKSGGSGTTIFRDVRFENRGELLLESGTLAFMGTSASFTQFSGTTSLFGGSLDSVPTLNFSGGILSGTGAISGSLSNTGATLQPGGIGAAGTLTVSQDYTQGAAATLEIELGGPNSGTDYDRLNVGATALLGGTLQVALIGGFTPGSSAVFDVVNAAVRTAAGTFSTVNAPGQLSANYTGTKAQLLTVDGSIPPTLSIGDASIFETDNETVLASFTVTLSRPSDQSITVQFATADGSATSPEDYAELALSTLVFEAGVTSRMVFVTVNGDTAFEPDETFLLNLRDPTNATISDGEAVGTIFNDDIGISSNGKTAILTDADGDRVVVKTSTGALKAENFVFAADGTLQTIDLAGDPRFRGADLKIMAEPRPGGDGQVSVGMLDATNIDLGKVTIDGALGMIVAGDGNAGTIGLQSLAVASLGTIGGATAPLTSTVTGALGTLSVSGDVNHAIVNVDGRLGHVNIGGDLIGAGGAALALAHSLGKSGRFILPRAGNGGIPEGVFAKGYGTFTLDGSLDGAAVVASGTAGSVEVGGNVSNGAVIAAARIPVVRLLSNLSSDDPNDPVMIAALGKAGANGIDKLMVRGDVENAQILLGYKSVKNAEGQLTEFGQNPDASVGKVLVKGNWTASSLAAGVLDTTGDGFGQNDTSIPGGKPNLISQIASIVIKGTATGSIAEGDNFGITAQKIGKLSINGESIALSKTRKDNILLDTNNDDFRVVEVRG